MRSGGDQMGEFRIRFVSNNEFKIHEASEILRPIGIDIIPVNLKIEELQTTDTERLVKDKVIKAFKAVGRPLFVEHTGLYLNYLNGLPGGLTQIVWDALQADRFSEIFGTASDPKVVARTTIGYIDGRKVYLFAGEISGKISDTPRGKQEFQWDCVFIPNGFTETFAQMEQKKNEISMRRNALDRFANFLKERGNR